MALCCPSPVRGLPCLSGCFYTKFVRPGLFTCSENLNPPPAGPSLLHYYLFHQTTDTNSHSPIKEEGGKQQWKDISTVVILLSSSLPSSSSIISSHTASHQEKSSFQPSTVRCTAKHTPRSLTSTSPLITLAFVHHLPVTLCSSSNRPTSYGKYKVAHL